ncbi:UPF0104 family protein, partial [Cronobacter sakazakii]|nr:UPF0104 family protein [Cronobacter sakazakii]
ALLAYRMLYFFAPLLLAIVIYLVLESRAKKLRAKNEQKLAKAQGSDSVREEDREPSLSLAKEK